MQRIRRHIRLDREALPLRRHIRLDRGAPRLAIALLAGTLLAALAVSASAALAARPPATPAWAAGRRVHFLPPPSAVPSRTPSLRSRAPGAGLGELGRRCEPSYCPLPPLRYHGGPIQAEPEVHLVFWGGNWNSTGASVRTQLVELFNHLSGSAWQGVLTQYWEFGPSRISGNIPAPASYTDTGVAAPSNVTDGAVRTEVANAISHNGWKRTANAQFVVFTAPGSTYAPEFTESGLFCAYHSYDGFNSVYSIMPYPEDEPFKDCLNYDAGANPGNVDSMTASHEYAESASDPLVDAWLDSEGYEIGDICASGDDVGPGGSYVQGLWDNDQYQCSLEDASPELSGEDLPAVTSLTPNEGPATGGTKVTIEGSELTGAESVRFGSVNASSFKVNSSTSIEAVAPAGTGTVNVVVTTESGASGRTSENEFTYESPPEYGRCLKAIAGHFSNSSCTTASGSGKYEWYPGFAGPQPLVKAHFSTKLKPHTTATLEIGATKKITCTGENGSGVYAGPRYIEQLKMSLTGCSMNKEACTSLSFEETEFFPKEGELALEEEFGTATSFEELGVEKAGVTAAKDKLATDLRTNFDILIFKCGNGATSVVFGSLIAPAKANKMQASETIKYTSVKGKQKPEKLEGLPADVLEIEAGAPPVPFGVKLTLVRTNEEAVEASSVN